MNVLIIFLNNLESFGVGGCELRSVDVHLCRFFDCTQYKPDSIDYYNKIKSEMGKVKPSVAP